MKPTLALLLSVLGTSPGCSKEAPSNADKPPAPGPPAAEPTAPESPSAAKPVATDSFETASGPLDLYAIHHGTVAFAFAGKTVVVDPWSKAPEGSLPKADLVLITDIHPDHLDTKAIEQVRMDGTVIIAPQAVAETVTEAQVLANGETTDQDGIAIEAVPMYNHTRGPKPGTLYHDKGRGNGYVLTFGELRVYVSGDTACTDEMKALKDIDIALVCMNLPYTMPPEEAAECVQAFAPKTVIPYHYRGSDLEVFTKALEGSGLEIRLRDFYSE